MSNLENKNKELINLILTIRGMAKKCSNPVFYKETLECMINMIDDCLKNEEENKD